MNEKEMNDICNSAFYTKEELVKDNRKLLEYIEQYKQALLDIKEYIEGLKGDYDYELQNCVEEEIFNIINKALKN